MKIKKLKRCLQFTAGDNSQLREIINPRKDKYRLNYSLAYARVKKGMKTLRHRLKYSEVYYILKGKGMMYINKEKKIVNTNDTIYIPPNSVQCIKNIGNCDLKFLCIVDPAWEPNCEEVIENG